MNPAPVPIPTTSSTVAVFRLCDWDNPAPGVWEAASSPYTTAGRPPFEAVAIVDPNADYVPIEQWWWSVFQPTDNTPTAGLAPIAVGHAPTLNDARRHCEHAAQTWRDQPHPSPGPLKKLTASTVLACTGCGLTVTAVEAIERGRCRDPFCGCEIFDGHHTTELAALLNQTEQGV